MTKHREPANNVTSQRDIRALPLGHLQLSPYTFRFTRTFTTIADLIVACERSEAFPVTARRAQREVASALEELSLVTSRRGVVDWDRFRDSRPRWIRGGSPVYFFGPSLQKVCETDRRRSLESLHLNRRALRALGKVQVRTIGTLVERARKGIGPLRGGGTSVVAEILDVLTALAKNVAASGEIDWVGYARFRSFLILPTRIRKCWPPRDFVRELPRVAKAMVLKRYGRQALTIFQERNLHPQRSISLAGIGKRFGQTKQHANVIEKRAIRMLRRVLLHDEYHDYAFRIRPEFTQPIKILATRSKRSKIPILSFAAWDRHLFETWGIHTDQIGRAERLVFKLLELGVGTQWKARPTLLWTQRSAGALNGALREIKRLLTRDHPQGLNPIELQTRLRRKFKARAPTMRELEALTRSLPDMEKHKGSLRPSLRVIRRIVDQCERVLKDAGRPLHRAEIVARLREEHAATDRLSPETVGNLLVRDKRFISIGHTGFWSLTTWDDVETRTIASIAAEILKHSNRPVHEDTLFDLISARRPVTRGSLEQALYREKRVRKMAPRTWELTRGSGSR